MPLALAIEVPMTPWMSISVKHKAHLAVHLNAPAQSSSQISTTGMTEVGNSAVFLILYKELYYRQVYANVSEGPSLEQQSESYYNYFNLFKDILNADGPVPLELPNLWFWDNINEFIYQFQYFSQYCCKTDKKSEEEIDFLCSSSKIWNVYSALNVLHFLVDKSNIN
ncbi:hypothetical protein GH733_001298 [Mirounga leonina]|nr:hypothetical protein GH733_001298 [Mirounga leonina]